MDETYTTAELIQLGKLIMAIELIRDGHVSRDAVAMELDVKPEKFTPYIGNLARYRPVDLAKKMLKELGK